VGAVSTVVPWRLFTVEVAAVRGLSPSFRRVTFAGPDLDRFADNGHDQRIKVAFPLRGHGFAHLPGGEDWYVRWRSLPDDLRNPVRTYTARAVRASRRELDIDFVLHGDGGPASRWASAARPGDRIMVLGPDAGFEGDHGGVEFRPPTSATILLAGDETAVPAICAILERLPDHTRGEALLEVPHAADELPVVAPIGMHVRWIGREGAGYGSGLIPAVVAAAGRLIPATAAGRLPPAGSSTVDEEFADIDVDVSELWEVPATAGGPLYAWLAGEAGVIRTLRRHLVADRGMDRATVAFMGYWRAGRPDAG
jgi:NADPH-dependent ferric siderophore reductase